MRSMRTNPEIIVLIFEFERDLNAYLATRSGVPVATLADVIQFNLDHADEELKFFGQELMELAESRRVQRNGVRGGARARPAACGTGGHRRSARGEQDLDALVAPTNTPAWPTDLIDGDAFLFGSSGFAAVAGYPLVSVTGGYTFDLPVGITFMASAWSEPTLIRIASGFEAAADVRRPPQFLRTFKTDGDASGRAGRSARPLRPAPCASYGTQLDKFMVPRLRRLMNL